jgi:hypothetical protein
MYVLKPEQKVKKRRKRKRSGIALEEILSLQEDNTVYHR